MSWRGWTANALLFAIMTLSYLMKDAQLERAGLHSFLLVVALILTTWLGLRVRRRPPERREEIRRAEVECSRPILWMAISFIIVTGLVVAVWGAQPFPLNLLLNVFVYIPATLVVLAHRRVAI